MTYLEQSETQSLAVSRDGGKTFEKLDIQPVISQPATETEPTAFRDPYWFRSYQLDALLGGNSTWYVIVAGGVKGSNMSDVGWESDGKSLHPSNLFFFFFGGSCLKSNECLEEKGERVCTAVNNTDLETWNSGARPISLQTVVR